MITPHKRLASFEVFGRPVPWKASQVEVAATADARIGAACGLKVKVKRRRAHKDKSLEEWQATVAQYARIGWGNGPPHEGPVEVIYWLGFAIPGTGKFSAHKPGDWHVATPDADNCGKAIGDALQDIVVANDKQIVKVQVVSQWQATDSARIVVIALAERRGADGVRDGDNECPF